MIPRRTSVKPNWVPRAATGTSQAATSPAPPPSAAPCTRATIGLGELYTVKNRSARAWASRRFSSRLKWTAAFIHCRSAPAQKAGPRPPSTITRTASTVPRSKRVLRSSVTMRPSNAFRASGRLSQTRVRGPSISSWSRSSFTGFSHAEDPEARLGDGRIQGGGEAEGEDGAGVRGGDDAVVPQPGRRVVGASLLFVLREDGRAQGLELPCRHRLPLALPLLLLHLAEHGGRLLAAHDRDPRVRPHPELARAVGPAAHAVVPRSEAAADDHGQLRHLGVRHRVDHLGPVLRDPLLLVLLAHDEARDVLEEDEGGLPEAAHLDEVGGLERALREEDAVVGEDAHRVARDPREARHQGGPVERLE